MKREGLSKNPELSRQRVLIVEVNWLGDVLFSTPAIRAIRRKHPGAYIAALVVPRCKQVLLGNNYLDEVIVLDEEDKHRGFWGKIKLIRGLRMRRFAVAYLFKSSATRCFWLFLAGIGSRIGYRKKKVNFLLTEAVAPPEGSFHRADLYYYLVAKTKIPEGERYYDFFVSSEDRAYIDSFLEKHGFGKDAHFVVLHVGGNWDLKRWPKENFAVLIDRLRSEYGQSAIISGSVGDYILAKKISDLTQHKPLLACGMTTLKQLGVLFQRSEVVISADSGPLHVAMAMEARTVSLFGPTSPQITGPFGRGDFSILRNQEIACVIPCYQAECRDNVCMKSISVDQVLDEVEKRGWLTKKR